MGSKEEASSQWPSQSMCQCKATNDQMWDYLQTKSAMLEGEKLLGGRKRTKRP